MRHKSAFLQQGGPLGSDNLGTLSMHVGVEGGIPNSHSPSNSKTALFLEAASSSVVPSLVHCTFCVIMLLLAEFQTLLKMTVRFLIIAMRVSHRPFTASNFFLREYSFFTLFSVRVFSIRSRNDVLGRNRGGFFYRKPLHVTVCTMRYKQNVMHS